MGDSLGIYWDGREGCWKEPEGIVEPGGLPGWGKAPGSGGIASGQLGLRGGEDGNPWSPQGRGRRNKSSTHIDVKFTGTPKHSGNSITIF